MHACVRITHVRMCTHVRMYACVACMDICTPVSSIISRYVHITNPNPNPNPKWRAPRCRASSRGTCSSQLSRGGGCLPATRSGLAAHLCIQMHVHVHMHAHIYICIYIYMYMYMYMYICIYRGGGCLRALAAHLCIHIHIHIHIQSRSPTAQTVVMYMYVYIYIYTYTEPLTDDPDCGEDTRAACLTHHRRSKDTPSQRRACDVLMEAVSK